MANIIENEEKTEAAKKLVSREETKVDDTFNRGCCGSADIDDECGCMADECGCVDPCCC